MAYTPEELEKYYRLRERKAKAAAAEGKPKAAIRTNAEGAEEKRKAKAEAEAKPGERKPFPLDELRGKKAVWVLRGGLKIEGILRAITAYEILLEDGNHKYLVFKHAVDYVIY